jgi:hypothetical protein
MGSMEVGWVHGLRSSGALKESGPILSKLGKL